MLTTADLGLAPASPSATRTRFVRVLRAFYLDGVLTPVGTLVEVRAPLAAELVAANKAALSEPPAPAKEDPAPAEPDDVSAQKPARRGRAKENAT